MIQCGLGIPMHNRMIAVSIVLNLEQQDEKCLKEYVKRFKQSHDVLNSHRHKVAGGTCQTNRYIQNEKDMYHTLRVIPQNKLTHNIHWISTIIQSQIIHRQTLCQIIVMMIQMSSMEVVGIQQDARLAMIVMIKAQQQMRLVCIICCAL